MTLKPLLRWCLLIHALPARPLYLRARVRRQLAEAGAAPLKKTVYVLPYSDEALGRLRAIADEIRSAGATAFVCKATFADREADRIVVRAYNEEQDARYRAWIRTASTRSARRGARSASASGSDRLKARPDADRLPRLRARLEALHAHDEFRAPGRAEAMAMLANLERGTRRRPRAGGKTPLVGLRWVTRKGLHVDRIACAWVVRRFVDPSATFRFVSSPDAPLAHGEIGFDMPGAAVTHEDGRCSVESLLIRARIRDTCVRRIAEIVHDIDLKDDRYRHPETVGFERLLVGTIAPLPDDTDRLERGLALFDALYVSLGRGAPSQGAPRRVPRVRIPPTVRAGRRS